MLLLSLIRPHPLPLAVGVGVASLLALQPVWKRHALSPLSASFSPLRCDASPSAFGRSKHDAKTPVVSGGKLNPKAIRQISIGSIAGLCCGLAVSVFSKPMAVLIGLLVFGVQALESRGLHIVPYSRIQRLFTETDVRSAIQDNVALKLSFGLTFALAAFAEL